MSPRVKNEISGTGKSAMEYLVRCYALTLAKDGINVNTVVPGMQCAVEPLQRQAVINILRHLQGTGSDMVSTREGLLCRLEQPLLLGC